MAQLSLSARVAQTTAGRDRVLDAVKVAALLVVMAGHSLAWHVWDEQAGNVLQVQPGLAAVTWFIQILALFFACGAVTNAQALARTGDPGGWSAHRMRRLLGPVLVYATAFSAVLLPLAAVLGDPVVEAGKFLSQLLWFAGVYLVVVAAAPWTVRHQGRGFLAGWLALIGAVDAVRLGALPAFGWLNLLLVWGWLHQVGYRLPDLRNAPRTRLLSGAAAALGVAVALTMIGPYSGSMITYAGDQKASNLAPPTIVVALHGLALILALAAAWRVLERILARPRLWAGVAILGARGLGLYLWHIPLVGAAAAAALLLGIELVPLSAPWWGVHLATAVVVIAGAWLLAGFADRALPALDRLPHRSTVRRPMALTAGAGIAVLFLSVTGFGSWWTVAFLGIPAGTPIVLGVLWLIWCLRRGLSPARPSAGNPLARAG